VGNPQEDLFSDYLYGENSTVILSGLDNLTEYTITIHAYAGGDSNLGADWYIGTNDGTPDHTWTQISSSPFAASTASFELIATSDISGIILLSVDNTAKTSRLNGLEIATAAVPEPSTIALIGLGGLALILPRRN
jgi:hypothetical protein